VSSIVPPATGVTLTASVPSPQTVGTSVTFTASGQGSAGYEYRFWLNDGTGWQIVRDYSTSPTWTLSRPAGTYYVTVYVRTSSAVGVDAEAGLGPYVINAAPAPATGVTLTPSTASVTFGTPVTFTAAGVGGAGTYEYKFWLFDGTSWQVVRDYATSPDWTLPGWAAPGSYVVTVYVRTTPTASLDAEAGAGPIVVAP
jgi:hypothetical protein